MVVYANIKEKEVNAKIVEVVRFANIREKEVHAKTVEVIVYANIKEEEAHAKTVSREVVDGKTQFMYYHLYHKCCIGHQVIKLTSEYYK